MVIQHKLCLSFLPQSRVQIDAVKTEEYKDNHLIIRVYFVSWFVLAMEFIKIGVPPLGGWMQSESELESLNVILKKQNENNHRETQIQVLAYLQTVTYKPSPIPHFERLHSICVTRKDERAGILHCNVFTSISPYLTANCYLRNTPS